MVASSGHAWLLPGEGSGGSRIFPGGARTPKVGVLTNFFGQKLHENERIWTPGGVHVPGTPP